MTQKKWTEHVLSDLLQKVNAGARRRDIAKAMGVSVSLIGLRVRQAKRQAKRQEQLRVNPPPFDPMGSLPTRLRSMLIADGIDSPEAVRRAISDGSLRDIPGMGAKSAACVVEWYSMQQWARPHAGDLR